MDLARRQQVSSRDGETMTITELGFFILGAAIASLPFTKGYWPKKEK